MTLLRAPIERCFDLARSVEVHLAGNVHSGEEAVAAGGVTEGLVGWHERVTWRARHFGVRWLPTSEITALQRPGFFRDEMVAGPFARMEHDHYFRATGPEQTEMRDVFVFAAPLGVLGRIAEWAVLRGYMAKLLAERNAAIREIAESAQWELILKSRRVVAGRLAAAGFRFEFPEWPSAARELARRWKEKRYGHG